jgi:hypothetical protein
MTSQRLIREMGQIESVRPAYPRENQWMDRFALRLKAYEFSAPTMALGKRVPEHTEVCRILPVKIQLIVPAAWFTNRSSLSLRRAKCYHQLVGGMSADTTSAHAERMLMITSD